MFPANAAGAYFCPFAFSSSSVPTVRPVGRYSLERSLSLSLSFHRRSDAERRKSVSSDAEMGEGGEEDDDGRGRACSRYRGGIVS